MSDGEGRNGVWLAEQGLDVLSIDFSPAAQAKARALAQARGVKFRWNMAVESLMAEGDAVTGVRCVNEDHRKEILAADG